MNVFKFGATLNFDVTDVRVTFEKPVNSKVFLVYGDDKHELTFNKDPLCSDPIEGLFLAGRHVEIVYELQKPSILQGTSHKKASP